MVLTQQEIEALLESVNCTRQKEIGCTECLSHIAEFAERELAGKSTAEGLEAVSHHLTLCAECREEYEAMQRALAALVVKTDSQT